MSVIKLFQEHIFPYWKSILVVLLPIVFSPVLIASDGKEAKAGYVILLVAVFWMTEAMPLPAASLLPVVLFPMLGVMSTGKVCRAYLNETTMMFIGSLMVALTVEYCNLHKRVALKVLLHVGTSPRWLILGFMLTTTILSMWISNTATTAMMVPIVDAVIRELYKENKESSKTRSTPIFQVESTTSVSALVPSSSSFSLDLTPVRHNSIESDESSQKIHESEKIELGEEGNNMRKCALLAVAYASNIGGTATLIGTGSNLVLKGVFKELYERAPGLNFATWMAFNIPGMLVNIFFAWIWLQFLFIGFKTKTGESDKAASVRKVLKVKYDDLGPLTFHELATALLFGICVLLWFFRDPQFIKGWADHFNEVKIDDATTVIGVVILLFVIPSRPRFWCFRAAKDQGPEKTSTALLDWSYVQEKLPWGIVLLLGGGFALSDASRSSGLSTWIGAQLTGLQQLPPFAIMIIICIMTATVTEVASNTATTNILLPILSEMALTIKVNPLYLMIPATVTCSYAFMLPVATPPNAIIFAASKMNPKEMVKAGFMLNIICVMVICLSMITLGNVMFHCDEFPDWALPNPQKSIASPVSNCSNTVLII